MSDYAIQVHGLGKRYRIGAGQAKYRTLRESISQLAASPLKRAKAIIDGGAAVGITESVWALRDVSFNVSHGEVVGIIGPNGAGKTTLLRILSRITKPTTGTVDISGRVGSLLEVGTGFHQELTGRENVYLNGAILGMKRSEIDRKFDDIVEFSGIGKFIDTPIKHFSSGMYVRLAFAVAAYLEPEILLVDEVLSVGDAAFQKRSMGKLNEAARSGGTVVFVSHNMAAIENLCHRGIVLVNGRIDFSGTQTAAIAHYIEKTKGLSSHTSLRDRQDRKGSGAVRLTGLQVRSTDGKKVNAASSGQTIDIIIEFDTRTGEPVRSVRAGITIATQFETPVFSLNTIDVGVEFEELPSSGSIACRVNRLPLPPGSYRISSTLKANNVLADQIYNAGELIVVEGDYFGSGRIPRQEAGVCLVEGRWRVL